LTDCFAGRFIFTFRHQLFGHTIATHINFPMKKFLLILGVLAQTFLSQAKEGMWIPSVLGAAFDDMKAMGLQLSAEDLYSLNHSSLKDAILIFGGGCTGEMVSDQGLLFTNHHCGFDNIQYHSTVEHDYLRDGFWAMNHSQELACPDLTATFIISMEDVTAQMLAGVSDTMQLASLNKIKAANKKKIEEEARKANKCDASVRAFNYGNQFFLVLSRTYTDVRLVGAPPSAIGKFGGDTDNWVWPRHNADFSVFRIYAGPNNEPVAYSKDNKPYKPGHFFPVCTSGVAEGDFTMVYGFPGRTDHFLTSYAVDFIVNRLNPFRIHMRETSLGILDKHMSSSQKVNIQYASKQSGISNAYKKWIGQDMGLKRFEALEAKKKVEEDFTAKINNDMYKSYQPVLPKLKDLYLKNEGINMAQSAFSEYVYYGPEIFAFAHDFQNFIQNYAKLDSAGTAQFMKKDLKAKVRNFFKDFDLATEKELFTALTPIYMKFVRDDLGPVAIQHQMKSMDAKDYCEILYTKTIFADSTKLLAFLDKVNKKSWKKMQKDPVFAISNELFAILDKELRPKVGDFSSSLDFLMGNYVKGLNKIYPDQTYWCDANSTMRVSYGKAEGSTPRDGTDYVYYTTAQGILDKYDPNFPDFIFPDRALELFRKKEFGKYAENGELRVAFTGSNHTTGGNSGSPALNATGQLIGINFDRSWESTMSDIYYSPEICRNIMVDIRYVLWVIDVYANAGYLLDEMKLEKK
jgi:hypothetical protein